MTGPLPSPALHGPAGERVIRTDEHETLVRTLQEERAAAQAAARWARFLSDASEALSGAVGLEATLDRVGALVVPALADYAQLWLHDPGAGDEGAPGPLRAVATRAAAPEVEEALRALAARRPVAADEPAPQARAARQGAPVLLPEVSEDLLRHVAEDDEHLRLLRRAGPRSLLAVPLVAGGRTLGALLLGLTGREQRFGAQDVAVAQELARRAALALDHARLYDAARAAQHAAEAANRAKSDFLATMSHELRTPLSAIIGYGELLHDGVLGPVADGQRAPLARIGASARHLLALIEDILLFARVEGGHDGPHPEPVDAAALAREVAEMIEPSALQHALAFTVRIPGGPLPVVTDARKVRQVLLNLLGNAVRYTEHGAVAFEVAPRDGGGVAFAVRDTGVGIAPEHHARVFDPFWQVDQSHTRRRGGTGLGLAVSRRLAALLGGTLTLESAPGVGSTFTLVLPAEPPADP